MELGRRAGFCTARPHLARRGHRCRLAHADLVLRVAVCGLHRRRGVFSPGVPERSQSQGPTCSLTPRSHRCGSPGQRGFRNLVNLAYCAPGICGCPQFELFVLGLRLTLASHGDLDVGDRCACYTPTPQRGDGSSGNGSRRDVDLGDILRSRTGRWMEDR